MDSKNVFKITNRLSKLIRQNLDPISVQKDKIIHSIRSDDLVKTINFALHDKPSLRNREETINICRKLIKHCSKSRNKYYFDNGEDTYATLAEMLYLSLCPDNNEKIFVKMKEYLDESIVHLFNLESKDIDIVYGMTNCELYLHIIYLAKKYNEIEINTKKIIKIDFNNEQHKKNVTITDNKEHVIMNYVNKESNCNEVIIEKNYTPNKKNYKIIMINCDINSKNYNNLKKALKLCNMENSIIRLNTGFKVGYEYDPDFSYLTKDIIINTIELCISNGYTPLMIISDIQYNIANLCKKYNIWYHFNLTKILENNNKKVNIISNSINYDVNILGSSILINHHISDNISNQVIDHANQNKNILKLWLSWKLYGKNGFNEWVKKSIDNAQIFKNKLINLKKFILIQNKFKKFEDISADTVCFLFDLKIKEIELTESTINLLNTKTEKIKNKIKESGKLFVNCSVGRNGLKYFRICFLCKSSNYYLTKEEIEKIPDMFERIANK